MLSKKNKESEILPSLEWQFDNIMENFDFKHVHMMMCWDKARVDYDDEGNHTGYHQWKMYNPVSKGFYEVPSIIDLKTIASKMLKEVIRFSKNNSKSKFYCTGTGPFKAIYRYGILELECVFENWSYD
jgi:hypothetical protein